MKTNKLIFLLLVLLFLAGTRSASAQITILSDSSHVFDATDCIKKSGENKLIFYFGSDYSLVPPSCASFFRESSYDSTRMVFDGPFKDYRYDSLLLVEGAYKNGYLDGPLTVRYMNGEVWQKGTFREGLMVGTWEYFYPDGTPMYSFSFQNDKLYVQDVRNGNGDQLLKNSNGNVIIRHYNSKSSKNFVETSWRGKIKDGLLDGRWRLYYFESPTKLSQIYSNGKFIKGYEGKKFFNAVSYFGLGQELAIFNAEKLQTGRCDPNPMNAVLPYYKKGWFDLKTDIYRVLDRQTDLKLNNTDIVISFKVDTDGALGEFKDVSNTGYEIYLINALKELGPWQPATNSKKNIPMSLVLTFDYANKIWRDKHGIYKAHKNTPLKEIKDSWNYGPPSSPAEKDPWIRAAGYKL